MKNIGYVGLGVMGHGMVSNLIKKCDAGTIIWGYDVVENAMQAFRDVGGKTASCPAELYKNCSIIFMCLPTNDLVYNTAKEILPAAGKGTTIIDMSSTSPYISKELYQRAKEKDVNFLDCPVSGGKVGADAGALAIMCGGDKDIFDIIRPYLEMMGKTVTYMGGSGCGSTAKLANNIMVGIHLIAMGEAFAFAKKAGLDPATLFEAIRHGAAQSTVMDIKMPKILERDFSAAARIAVHLKDIDNALDMAQKLEVDLPITQLVKEQMDYMKDNGMINEDQCALVKYYENSMDVEVK
ncbi:MAG: NAD(P)-dependent oxidoreductase [Lachnospiraceae bacterium]|nr:NAD(P)-dependent oxidoreductase [Lachnospiraceae bacterium]